MADEQTWWKEISAGIVAALVGIFGIKKKQGSGYVKKLACKEHREIIVDQTRVDKGEILTAIETLRQDMLTHIERERRDLSNENLLNRLKIMREQEDGRKE